MKNNINSTFADESQTGTASMAEILAKISGYPSPRGHAKSTDDEGRASSDNDIA